MFTLRLLKPLNLETVFSGGGRGFWFKTERNAAIWRRDVKTTRLPDEWCPLQVHGAAGATGQDQIPVEHQAGLGVFRATSLSGLRVTATTRGVCGPQRTCCFGVSHVVCHAEP